LNCKYAFFELGELHQKLKKHLKNYVMKKFNLNVTTVNQSNLLQPVLKSDKCQLVQLVEKRYGVKILQEMYTTKESYNGYGQTPDWIDYVYSYFSTRMELRVIQPEFYMKDLDFKSLFGLYRMTDTMEFSHKNHKNDIYRTYNTPMAYLIPVILVKYKKSTIAFRTDNKIITEMFEDTGAIISGNLTQEEISDIDKRQKHQIEYIEYAYSGIEYRTGCRNWEKIFWEKFYLDKGDMLHSEYLEWKSVHIN
jgi:hypothetical protein